MNLGSQVVCLRSGAAGGGTFNDLAPEDRPQIELDIQEYCIVALDAKGNRVSVFCSSGAPITPDITIENGVHVLANFGSLQDSTLRITGSCKQLTLLQNGASVILVNAASVGLETLSVTLQGGQYLTDLIVSGNTLTSIELNAFELGSDGSAYGIQNLDLSNCGIINDFLDEEILVRDLWSFDLSGNDLTETAVNLILAKFLAAAQVFTDPEGINGTITTASINLSGGTSSAPTGQGILDAAALVLLGVTVTTN